MEKLPTASEFDTVNAIDAFQIRFHISIDGLIDPAADVGRHSCNLRTPPIHSGILIFRRHTQQIS